MSEPYVDPKVAGRPRLLPGVPFPPYAFVPGRGPHPLSDPRGHSHGTPREAPDRLDPHNWRLCRAYLHGVDLFNHGYYWEAHEAWEGLWNACGRAGVTADFLKGLIQLAVAGVKVRQEMPEGVARHARRAAELFQQVAGTGKADDGRYLGLSLSDLVGYAAEAERARPGSAGGVAPVFPFALNPQ